MNEEEFSKLPLAEQKRRTQQLWDSMNRDVIQRMQERYCSNCGTVLLDHNQTDFCSRCHQLIEIYRKNNWWFHDDEHIEHDEDQYI